jgi:hypothetical protein
MAEGISYGSRSSVLDVSKLPTVQFGTKSLTWCGIIGTMAIEGMFFVLTIASYFYLHSRSVEWQPHENPPMLFWGILNLAVFLLSVIPTEWYRRRARKGDGKAVRIGLALVALIGVINLVIRYFELRHLNCDWSSCARNEKEHTGAWAVRGDGWSEPQAFDFAKAPQSHSCCTDLARGGCGALVQPNRAIPLFTQPTILRGKMFDRNTYLF